MVVPGSRSALEVSHAVVGDVAGAYYHKGLNFVWAGFLKQSEGE